MSAPRRRHNGMPGFEERSEEPFPLAIGEFRGLRAWDMLQPPPDYYDWVQLPESGLMAKQRVQQQVNLLQGAYSYVWEPGENVARCEEGHQVPCDATCPRNYRERRSLQECRCACGFWAYWDAASVREQTGSKKRAVIGVVEGYGRAIEGERGFRAAKARIVGLHMAFRIEPRGPLQERHASYIDVASIGSWHPVRVTSHYDDVYGPPGPQDVLRAEAETLDLQERLQKTYGVPVYDSVELMLWKHPLGTGENPRQSRDW